MLKRKLTRFLALLLVLVIPSAHAAVGTLTFGEDSEDDGTMLSYAKAATFVQDTVYFISSPKDLSSGDQLYAWKGGEDAPVSLELLMEMVWSESDGDEEHVEEGEASEASPAEEPVEETIGENVVPVVSDTRIKWPRHQYSFITSDGERLLSFDAFSGRLTELVVEGTKVTEKELLRANMPEEEKALEYRSYNVCGVHAGKMIFYSDLHDEAGNQRKNPLMVLDIATGEVKYVPVDMAINALPYRDDSLLVVVQEFEKSYDEVTRKSISPNYVIYNLTSGQVTGEGTLPVESVHGGMAYLKDADAVVYLNRGKIMEMINDLREVKQIGYTTRDYVETMGVMPDGSLAVFSYNGLDILPISQDFNPNEYLNVYGGYMDSGTRAFVKKFPNVPVYSTENYYDTMADMAAALMAGEEIDVLRMSSAYSPFSQMKKKGYCADLSGDAEIAALMDRVYPFLKEKCIQDGKVVAVPFRMYMHMDAFSDDVMKQMKLTEAELPSNMVELCEFVNRWNDEFAEDFPQIMPIDVWEEGTKQTLLLMILDRYSLYMEYEGRPLSFETPEFREVITAWQNVHTEELDRNVKRVMEEEGGWEALINAYGGFDDIYGYYTQKQLSLTAQTPALYEMEGSFAFINPRTTRMNYALELLKSYVDNMEGISAYLVMSDKTEPLENPYFAQNLRSAQNWVEETEKLLAKASDEEKRELEDNLKAAQKELEETQKRKYTISLEKLENYKTNIAPHVVVRTSSPWNFGSADMSEEIRSLINRLSQGEMSVDQFITEMDGKLRMIQLENQ